MARLFDIVFFLYFLTHIPIAMFVDSQAVFPERFYPQKLIDLKNWYCQEFRDPMMMEPPAWFQAFCLCEMFLQFPFFFVAAYAYLKGASKARWIRLPVIIYASHVATTLLAIFHHTLRHDFSKSKYPGPRNMEERLQLCAIYSPFFLVPVMILFDASLNAVYQEPVKAKRG